MTHLVHVLWSCSLLALAAICTEPVMSNSLQHILHYDSNSLRDIRANMTPQQLTLPRDVFASIKSHGIGKWRRVHRGCRAGKQKVRGYSTIDIHNQRHSCNALMTKLGLLNCQSACNKASLIKDHIIDHDIDILALTETWFKSENDQNSANLSPKGYNLVHALRKGRRGGGVALLCKSGLTASVSKQPPTTRRYPLLPLNTSQLTLSTTITT